MLGGRLLASALAISSALALGACGSSKSAVKSAGQTGSASTQTQSTSTVSAVALPASESGKREATIRVSSAVPLLGGGMNQRFTCHGGNVSPQLKWHNLPPESKEVMVFVRTIAGRSVATNWALAGLSPSLTGISAGTTPAGAIVGRNGFGSIGYSLCPPKKSFVTFAVYAFPYKLGLKSGFDPSSVTPRLEKTEVAWGGLTMVPYAPTAK